MDITIPVVLKDLFDRISANRGFGLTGLLAHWELFSRAGELVAKDGFVGSLTRLVETYEAPPGESAPVQRPSIQDVKRENLRQLWEERLSAFLGFAVTVPLPPALNRKQTRALTRYGFLILFIPAVAESKLPAHAVKPNWGQYLQVESVERIPLAGRWVAVETIKKPNYGDGAYPNDALAAGIGIASRFSHPHSGKGDGDDIVEDLLPKVAGKIGFDAASVQLPSAEEWNFVANLFNWLRETFNLPLPNLGSTESWEWCRNAYGSGPRLLAGCRDRGGLAAVYSRWHGDPIAYVAFRVLVVLS